MRRRWYWNGSWGGGGFIERGPWSLNCRYNLHELIIGVRITVNKSWEPDWHYVEGEIGAGCIYLGLTYAKNPKGYTA